METKPRHFAPTGLGVGLLHALLPFVAMYTIWLIETAFKARFAVSSKFHQGLDVLGYLLLVFSAMNLGVVQLYRSEPKMPRLVRLFLPLACHQVQSGAHSLGDSAPRAVRGAVVSSRGEGGVVRRAQ